MEYLTREMLLEIIETNADTCISIYLPTEKAGKDIWAGRIRLKNLLKQVNTELENCKSQLDNHHRILKESLKPLYQLLDDTHFWQHQSNGLAIFVTSKGTHYYKVPIKVGMRIVISDKIYIKPLLKLFHSIEFYILSLNLNDIKLFKCDNYSIEKVNIDEAPNNIEEALKYDDNEEQYQFHIGSSKKLHSNSKDSYFSEGEKINKHKQDITRFFYKISNVLVDKKIIDSKTPVILAGVNYITSIYKELNLSCDILENTIEGNIEDLNEKELYLKAVQVVNPCFKKRIIQKITTRYEVFNIDKIKTEILDIAPAAYNGRVETFILSTDSCKSGSFDNVSNMIIYSNNNRNICKNDDLINATAIYVLLKGGDVYILDKKYIPNNNDYMAFLRY